VVPGCIDQKPAGVGVAGLGDRPRDRLCPEECALGTSPEVGADAGAGEPVPVADLDGQRERGQGGDATQDANRCTIEVNSQSAAITVIFSSSRSRRPPASATVS